MAKEGEEIIQDAVPEKTKVELFVENPDRFIDGSTLIIALQRTEQGPALCMGIRNRAEAIMALGELQAALLGIITQADLARKQKSAPARGGILTAARRNLFKR